MNLSFDAATHTYTLDGSVVPSVTQVLAHCYSFDRVRSGVLEHKRQIGEALDEIIELDLADDLIEDSVDPAMKGYFAAWRKFRVEYPQFIAIASQTRVASSKYRYAGTPDAWGTLHDGDEALVDWKATRTMHPAVALQTAAYVAAGAEMGLFKPTIKRCAVQFKEDGRYNIVPYQDKNDFNIFLAFLSTHNWRARNGCLPKEKS